MNNHEYALHLGHPYLKRFFENETRLIADLIRKKYETTRCCVLLLKKINKSLFLLAYFINQLFLSLWHAYYMVVFSIASFYQVIQVRSALLELDGVQV